MAKTDEMLSYFKAYIGQWCCSTCACPKSGQPAAQFRECKKMGYKFEEFKPGRWAQSMYCEKCGQQTPHYKLLKPDPEFEEKPRISITLKTRERILKIFDHRDAFTGGRITSTAEIDHKVPWTRLNHDVDANAMDDNEVRRNFQLLTREHNLLKDRACSFCKQMGKRLPLFGINFWYEGDEDYAGTCEGCGWYDGLEWRKRLNEELLKVANYVDGK